jgi:membrane-associated phospholipid phosphatase
VEDSASIQTGQRFSMHINQVTLESRYGLLGMSAIAIPLIVVSYCFLDIPVAEFVAKTVGFDFLLSGHVSTIPDTLLVLVCLVGVVGWSVHLWRARTVARPKLPDVYALLGSSVPLAFMLKAIIKYVFGRTNTRLWLVNPELYGLHWFDGGGQYASFPSGHMAVFTAMMLAMCRQVPQLRRACMGFLLCLTLALIVTEYHFLSDVIAGVYLGMVVDVLTWRGLVFAYGTRHSLSQDTESTGTAGQSGR